MFPPSPGGSLFHFIFEHVPDPLGQILGRHRFFQVIHALSLEQFDEKRFIEKRGEGEAGDPYAGSAMNRRNNRSRAQQGRRSQGNNQNMTMAQRLMTRDRNKDGKISKDEAPPPMQQRFDSMDKNGDGFIDKAEMQNMRPPQGRQRR